MITKLFCFVATVCCLTSFKVQAYSGGSGSESDPYQIGDREDLFILITNEVNYGSHFVLTADIDLTNQLFATAVIAPDTSISTSFQGTKFTGIFDGAGHTISNFVIHTKGESNDYLGLFGYLSNGEVKNLCLTNVNITAGSDSDYVGGLCGYNSYGMIRDCYAEAAISSDDNIGGLCGYNYRGTIRDSYANSVVSGNDYIGGLCGNNYYGFIYECFADAVVSGDNYIGGVCGYNYYGTINDSYAIGRVDGSAYVGGLNGYNSSGLIKNSYAAASVSGSSRTGGLCGYVNTGTVIESFWDTEVSGQPSSAGGTAKTTAEMQTSATFANAGWVFADTQTGARGWFMPADDYPQLYWQNAAAAPVPEMAGMSLAEAQAALTDAGLTTGLVYYVASWQIPSNTVAGVTASVAGYVETTHPIDIFVSTGGSGDGSAATPYQIASFSDLEAVNTAPASNFVMTADVYVGYQGPRIKALIAPDTSNNSGYQGSPFTGGFDGGGHSVWNFSIYAAHYSYAYLGLFGYISGANASVRNTGLEGIYVVGGNGSDYGGGVCGYNYYGIISNCCVSGRVAGVNDADNFGGLCGYNSYGTISDCFAETTVSGDAYIGGLCGYNYRGTIRDSYANSVVSGNDYIGGLCGNNYYGFIYECFADAVVSGDNYIGGLCGYNYYGTINDSYAIGTVVGSDSVGGLCGYNSSGLIRNSYSAASVSGSTRTGGFCGYNNSGIIADCFWDTEISGQAVSGGGIGKTTPEMQTPATFANAGWDFAGEPINGSDDNWKMDLYPVLAWQSTVARSTNELIVVNGSGSGLYKNGQAAAITADAPEPGYEFTNWRSDPPAYTNNLTDSSALSTTFIMPDEDVTLSANYFQWDTDIDGIPDVWEQQIVDGDPNDAILSVNDVLFEDDFDQDGIQNGFEYAFGDNLQPGDPLLNILMINGQPVAEIPKQDEATLPYVEITVLGSLNLTDWTLPVIPATDTTGKPADRSWFETQSTQNNAFFRLKAEVKD